MENDCDSLSDESSRLRRISAFHERFAPSLNRFLFKTLEVDFKVSLVSVEIGCRDFDSSELILFRAGQDSPAAALLIPRSFLLGVIDRYLGNDHFTPDAETDIWSELDEELSVPFASRLFEIVLGFCAPSASFPFNEISILSDGFSPEGDWFTINWSVTCGDRTFPFSFFLPAEVASGEDTLHHDEPLMPKTDEELLRYIEMRRATSEKKHDTESSFPSSRSSEQIANIRVLVGSFDLHRNDFNEMKPGDILATDISSDALFTLFLNGVPVCHARPGEDNGNKAVIVEDIL